MSSGRLELKFLVPAAVVPHLVQQLAPFVIPDPKAPLPQRVESLYFDDPGMRFYWDREESVGYRRKVRLRRYVVDQTTTYATLEIKEKHKSRVVKKRARVDSNLADAIFQGKISLVNLLQSGSADATIRETGYLLQRLQLIPVVTVAYTRTSWIGRFDHQLRLTLDSGIEGIDVRGQVCRELFGNARGIFEVKTAGEVPSWLTAIARHFEMAQTRASKYCTAVRALYQPAASPLD